MGNAGEIFSLNVSVAFDTPCVIDLKVLDDVSFSSAPALSSELPLTPFLLSPFLNDCRAP
ncbi:hypothetical protein GN244_ATG10572 [Phytophthora infestans]|uniref:Uncharacterized protein n=1 Tax=Phytophthora infestans TaxID=4787 RepID=A0A833SS73_PHYIN|nr:hypothetical protein GN244_ATG10572 [Phytophthora infestans]